MTATHRGRLNKVLQVTLSFWIISGLADGAGAARVKAFPIVGVAKDCLLMHYVFSCTRLEHHPARQNNSLPETFDVGNDSSVHMHKG